MQNDSSHELSSFFEKQLERTNYWLSFAEAKNAALIALNVAMIAFLAELKVECSAFKTLLIALFVISCVICMRSFSPNTKNRVHTVRTSEGHDNLVFWNDIATIEDEQRYIDLVKERYFKEMNFNMEQDKLSYDLASEIIINSRIAKNKYLLFKIALCVDICSFVLFIVFLIAA
jgi:hypothetical protein